MPSALIITEAEIAARNAYPAITGLRPPRKRPSWTVVRGLRPEIAQLAVGIESPHQRRLVLVQAKGRASASELGRAFGISRNTVVGIWYREAKRAASSDRLATARSARAI